MTTRKQKRQRPETVRHSLHVELGDVKRPNPYFSHDHAENAGNPRFVRVMINQRESPIAWMYRHPQHYPMYMVEMALRFHALHQKLAGRGSQGIDMTREPVQGGKRSDGLTDARMDASKEREQIKLALGPAGFELVENVCGKCIGLKDLYPRKRLRDRMAKHLKDCLHTLAIFWRKVPPNTTRHSKWSGSREDLTP